MKFTVREQAGGIIVTLFNNDADRSTPTIEQVKVSLTRAGFQAHVVPPDQIFVESNNIDLDIETIYYGLCHEFEY